MTGFHTFRVVGDKKPKIVHWQHLQANLYQFCSLLHVVCVVLAQIH